MILKVAEVETAAFQCTTICVCGGNFEHYIVLVVEGLNIINSYAIYDLVTGPEQPIYVVLCVQYESKKLGKDQESI